MKVKAENSAIQGKGVFTLKDMVIGKLVMRIDDSRLIDSEHPLIFSEDEEYTDYLENDKTVLMHEPERYINHSCDPNVYTRTLLNKRYIFSRRHIKAGEEITYDYTINSLGDTVWQCNCGATRCRKNVHSNFFQLPAEFQVEYLPLLEKWFIIESKNEINELINKFLLSS